MAFQLYNSLSNKKELFKSLKDREAKVYFCGPTVYHFQHIGNYRTYVFWDVLVRMLRYFDYKTTHVMNITDVGHLTADDLLSSDTGEDKLEKAAKRENKSVWDIAKFYEDDFIIGLEHLHVHLPDHLTRATDHIDQMITMISTLIDRDIAYVTPSGVYFDISRFEDYGKLSGNTLEQLNAGASGRVEQIEDKRSPQDFALWVLKKEQSMMWDSPWGRGYPGWHIECSAMSRAYLGEHIDIHGGAIDNKFPHHECEIAQSEASSTPSKKPLPFVKYWLHAGHMTVNGEKMSKSKGNVYTLDDLRKRGVKMRALRMMYLSSHYRSSMDYSENAVDQAEKNLMTFDRLFERLQRVTLEGEIAMEFSDMLNEYLLSCVSALEDDLNTPELLAVLYDFASMLNRMMDDDALNMAMASAALAWLRSLDTVLGMLDPKPWNTLAEGVGVPKEIEALANERLEAKQQKNFARSDELREQIRASGFDIEDTKDGFVLRKLD